MQDNDFRAAVRRMAASCAPTFGKADDARQKRWTLASRGTGTEARGRGYGSATTHRHDPAT